MGITELKRRAISFYINSRGWRTGRKLVVIESDDWGSIRMPSREVYQKFLDLGYPVDRLSYLKYDSLESNRDLEALFEVLTSVRDGKGNHPVITANVIMTNPDFDKIRQSGFKEYHSELFTDTLKRYPEHDRVMDLYKEGIEKHIFHPQLHGREHLNVNRWMNAIREEKSDARLAFDHGFFDLSDSHTEITNNSFMDALSPATKKELDEQRLGLQQATSLFQKVFGYSSLSFIAPAYIWRTEIEESLAQNGIRYIQSNVYQKIPATGRVNSFRKKLHFTGEVNRWGQLFTVRNAAFEPSSFHASKAKDLCLLKIEKAFNNQKPAIICSHRLNFMGSLFPENRDANLLILKDLLDEMVQKWSEVEFITSDQLGGIIQEK